MPKIIHYRNKCIGCGICFELQPEYWRMSRKDGKATLLKATLKKELFILPVPEASKAHTIDVANACPVKIIKVQ
jgi:ferredoxin